MCGLGPLYALGCTVHSVTIFKKLKTEKKIVKSYKFKKNKKVTDVWLERAHIFWFLQYVDTASAQARSGV